MNRPFASLVLGVLGVATACSHARPSPALYGPRSEGAEASSRASVRCEAVTGRPCKHPARNLHAPTYPPPRSDPGRVDSRPRQYPRDATWQEFQANAENYVVGVTPRNQTPINERADPFAAYLAEFHRVLHREFALRFIESLPSDGELGDLTLLSKVEMVIDPDGSLNRVGVVKSSGNLRYDLGVFNAVRAGAPYPAPPPSIRSADGRTYVRWALNRGESQCGTWNAEPFILR